MARTTTSSTASSTKATKAATAKANRQAAKATKAGQQAAAQAAASVAAQQASAREELAAPSPETPAAPPSPETAPETYACGMCQFEAPTGEAVMQHIDTAHPAPATMQNVVASAPETAPAAPPAAPKAAKAPKAAPKAPPAPRTKAVALLTYRTVLGTDTPEMVVLPNAQAGVLACQQARNGGQWRAVELRPLGANGQPDASRSIWHWHYGQCPATRKALAAAIAAGTIDKEQALAEQRQAVAATNAQRPPSKLFAPRR